MCLSSEAQAELLAQLRQQGGVRAAHAQAEVMSLGGSPHDQLAGVPAPRGRVVAQAELAEHRDVTAPRLADAPQGFDALDGDELPGAVPVVAPCREPAGPYALVHSP